MGSSSQAKAIANCTMNSVNSNYSNPRSEDKLPSSSGWLVSPSRDRVLFFIRDPKSQIHCQNVMTQLWYCTIEGIPTKLKNTRRMELESAIETWHELTNNGWEIIGEQINNKVA